MSRRHRDIDSDTIWVAFLMISIGLPELLIIAAVIIGLVFGLRALFKK